MSGAGGFFGTDVLRLLFLRFSGTDVSVFSIGLYSFTVGFSFRMLFFGCAFSECAF